MFLMIDNYDSFTYNLVQYLGSWARTYLPQRPDYGGGDRAAEARSHRDFARPCTPTEAGVSVETIQKLAGRIPILGVCLGHQSIGQAFGGKIVRAKQLMHRQDFDDSP